MNKISLALLSCAFLLLIPLKYLSAQEYDAGLWLSLKGEIILTQRMTFGIAEEIRLHENITEVGTALTDIGIDYNLSSGWRISANYRFISRQQLDRSYLHRHRYYLDLRYRHLSDRTGIDFTGRLRWQQQLSHEEIGLPGNEGFSNYLRPEGTVRYRLNRVFRPYVSVETFLPVSAFRFHNPDKIRITAGTRIRLNFVHSVTLFYMVQKEINVRRPETDFVIGLGYEFSPFNSGL